MPLVPPLLAIALLPALIGWLFSAIAWARVYRAPGDASRIEAVRLGALVVAFASAATAAAIAVALTA